MRTTFFDDPAQARRGIGSLAACVAGLRWLIRQTAVVAMAIWFGGFTFYSADVIWVLHDEMGSIEAGFISQRVSDHLNLLGAGALVACWLWLAVEPVARSGWRGKARFALVSLSSGALVGLFLLHDVLDQRLETQGLSGFYRWHEYYLSLATAQWAVNLIWILLGTEGRRFISPERG